MQKKVKRVIIDTNLWITFLISKDFSKLEAVIYSDNAILVFSRELLAEFLEVASREKFRRYFPFKATEKISETMGEFGDLVQLQTKVEICRDPNDNFLLALAIDGKADFLLTGDKDLLAIKKFGETTILTISDFLNGNFS